METASSSWGVPSSVYPSYLDTPLNNSTTRNSRTSPSHQTTHLDHSPPPIELLGYGLSSHDDVSSSLGGGGGGGGGARADSVGPSEFSPFADHNGAGSLGQSHHLNGAGGGGGGVHGDELSNGGGYLLGSGDDGLSSLGGVDEGSHAGASAYNDAGEAAQGIRLDSVYAGTALHEDDLPEGHEYDYDNDGADEGLLDDDGEAHLGEGGVPALADLPAGAEDEHEPLYVNAKQYHRIMKRRIARQRLEEMGRLSRQRKPYLHESRHAHAMRRPRGPGGRFLTLEERAILEAGGSIEGVVWPPPDTKTP